MLQEEQMAVRGGTPLYGYTMGIIVLDQRKIAASVAVPVFTSVCCRFRWWPACCVRSRKWAC
jgi:hypothetical protein